MSGLNRLLIQIISIHAPLAGCDSASASADLIVPLFQSTHPLRGATTRSSPVPSIRVISIHAPLAGRDGIHGLGFRCHRGFQSTRPLRGATERKLCVVLTVIISIHAPLAGRDRQDVYGDHARRNFNPRAPCGARPAIPRSSVSIALFQSTRPLRGATMLVRLQQHRRPQFQSTHPLRGATSASTYLSLVDVHFNPRTPCGVRPNAAKEFSEYEYISIHAPLAGCDRRMPCSRQRRMVISIHAPLAGCD